MSLLSMKKKRVKGKTEASRYFIIDNHFPMNKRIKREIINVQIIRTGLIPGSIKVQI